MKADDVEYLFEKCKNEIPEFMSKTHINPFDVKDGRRDGNPYHH